MQVTESQRAALFIGLCIPVRAAIAYYAKEASPKQLQLMGAIALIVSLNFFFVWLLKLRGEKGAFGGQVWWKELRLAHSLIIFVFAVSALNKNKYSWQWLALDTSIGLLAFTLHK